MRVDSALGDSVEFLRCEDVEALEMGVEIVEEGGEQGEDDGNGGEGAHCEEYFRS